MAHKSISLTGQNRQRNKTLFAQKKKKKKPKKERGIQEPSQITKHHEDGIANRMTPSIDRSIAI